MRMSVNEKMLCDTDMNINHCISTHSNCYLPSFFVLFSCFLSFFQISFLIFAAQQNKRILAVFREWTSFPSNENSSKVGADRITRDKVKKMKNLLEDNLPTENVVTLA